MNVPNHYFRFLPIALLIVSGCGSQMVPVTGTVQRNGQIIPGGSVLFRPVSSEGKSAVGEIQPDGKFQMMTESPGDGVMIGSYRVVIVGQRGAKDRALRTTYLGPNDKLVDVIAGEPNVVDIN